MPVIPERGTATGRALLEGKVVHIPDVQADPEYTFVEAQKLGVISHHSERSDVTRRNSNWRSGL